MRPRSFAQGRRPLEAGFNPPRSSAVAFWRERDKDSSAVLAVEQRFNVSRRWHSRAGSPRWLMLAQRIARGRSVEVVGQPSVPVAQVT
jgi:hypothetical protein